MGRCVECVECVCVWESGRGGFSEAMRLITGGRQWLSWLWLWACELSGCEISGSVVVRSVAQWLIQWL